MSPRRRRRVRLPTIDDYIARWDDVHHRMEAGESYAEIGRALGLRPSHARAIAIQPREAAGGHLAMERRNREIARAYLRPTGRRPTMAELGERYGLTRARIAAIIARTSPR